MEVASLLDPSGFPIDLLDTAAVTTHIDARRKQPDAAVEGTRFANAELIGEDCREALDNLARFNLVTLDEENDRVRVHALVQRSASEHLDSAGLGMLASTVADALIEKWPDIERDTERAQLLRSNVAALIEHAGEALCKLHVHAVLWRAGRSLGECGLIEAAISHWAAMLGKAEQRLGLDHPDTLATRQTSPAGGGGGGCGRGRHRHPRSCWPTGCGCWAPTTPTP